MSSFEFVNLCETGYYKTYKCHPVDIMEDLALYNLSYNGFVTNIVILFNIFELMLIRFSRMVKG